MKKILIVVGTRPNFIKVTQFKSVAKKYHDLEFKIVHTGQHYDTKMSDVFFEQFKLNPDFLLNIEPQSANAQMAEIMIKLELLIKNQYTPDIGIVVGDVNSTLAAALTFNKLGITLAHLESGLRSCDRGMPEEINRILTDEISDLFFITEQSGTDNLISEGKAKSKMHFVGNTMIDTMVAFDEEIKASNILNEIKINNSEYVLMTMHRPATVDNVVALSQLFDLLEVILKKYLIVFPLHPRTLSKIKELGFTERITNNPKLIITEPLDYFSFQKLINESKFIITDSGGIQEESTFRNIPCLTLRPNTERPSTVNIGSNSLVPFSINAISNEIDKIESGQYKKGHIPPFWDGGATERIVEILSKL
jgi:UDP-N-acetylglucosamine 2-epimerase (non-hydrolysing)